MDQKASGLKKGFYSTITLKQLGKARNSKYKPFPPKNTYFDFDFKNFKTPEENDIYASIRQTTEAMLNPPISNLGIKGIKRTADEIGKWKEMFNDTELRLNLFTLYIFIEIGGTGGGSFRYMYSRFLNEAAKIAGNNNLMKAAEKINSSGKLFTEVGLLFKDAENIPYLEDRIKKAQELYLKIAEIEESAFNDLLKIVP
jgi:hypothetical protein